MALGLRDSANLVRKRQCLREVLEGAEPHQMPFAVEFPAPAEFLQQLSLARRPFNEGTLAPSLQFLSASLIGVSPQLFSMARSITEEVWLDYSFDQWVDHLLPQWSSSYCWWSKLSFSDYLFYH